MKKSRTMWEFAFKNLWLNKSRSTLALVGLSVAIIGLIALISLSAGISTMVTDSISMFGGIFVMEPGVVDDVYSNVDIKFLSDLEDIQGVRAVVPYITAVQTSIDGGKGGLEAAPLGGMIGISGEDVSKSPMLLDGGVYKKNVKKGRYLVPSDTNALVVGAEFAKTYKKSVGSTLTFSDEDKKFKVVGIIETGGMFDNIVVAPIDAAREISGKASDMVSYYYVELDDPSYEQKVVNKINFKYEDDLEATTSSEFGEQFGVILESLDAFFILISSVAIIVGGIGILNTMLMSVMDRFKEFGILKAIGWANEDILKLVLFESIVLGVIGGIIGVLLGSFFVLLMSTALPFTPVITIELVITSLIIAVSLSVIGGIYPAWKAAKLDPVEAIRFG